MTLERPRPYWIAFGRDLEQAAALYNENAQVAGLPLGQALPGDLRLRGYVRDRAILARGGPSSVCRQESGGISATCEG